tara:strand:- start:337 stop:576 length:240 start_codon:yes stop_codon:yes gene_type:complete
MENFYVYSKTGCTWCKQIKQIMTLKKIPFVELKLNEDFTLEDFIIKFNKTSFPQILHGEEYIGDCIDTIKYLKNNNIIT